MNGTQVQGFLPRQMENGQNDRVDGRGTRASPVDAVDDSAAGQNQTDMNALPGSEMLKSQENRHGPPDVEVKGLKWSVHIPELTRREIDLPSHCLLRPYEQPWTGEGQRRIDLAERLAFIHGRSCLRRRAGVDRNPSRSRCCPAAPYPVDNLGTCLEDGVRNGSEL